MFDPVLDKPIRGARNIAAAVNLYNEAGEPDERAAYHALEAGHYDATKRGRTWESTLRRLLAPHLAHITA
jgi:hypothetical protein